MSTATNARAAPARPLWDRPRARTVLWLLLAGAVAALAAPRFLPFYDSYEWLLQGQIVHDLWTGATSDGVTAPGVVPVFPAQLLVTTALIGVVGWNIRCRRLLVALHTPPATAALLLLAMAVLDPVDNLNSLTKPDQRLLFPAVLLLLATLSWRPMRGGRPQSSAPSW